MNQTWENDEKPNFRPNFGQNVGPQNLFCGFYLHWYLDIVPSYQPMQFLGKLLNQTWRNDKKPNFGYNFDLF